MKRKRFTDQEKEELLMNPNILKVGDCSVTYRPEFKVKAIEDYQQGISPSMIFIKASFSLDVIGKKQPARCLRRWMKTFKDKGAKGLASEARGSTKAGGRPRARPLTPEEELKQLRAQNALLKAENDFLKKLDLIERGLM